MYRFYFTAACYGFGVCAVLNSLAFLGSHWNVHFKAWVSTKVMQDLEDGDAFFVMPTKYIGAPELVTLERRTLVRARTGELHGRRNHQGTMAQL